MGGGDDTLCASCRLSDTFQRAFAGSVGGDDAYTRFRADEATASYRSSENF